VAKGNSAAKEPKSVLLHRLVFERKPLGITTTVETLDPFDKASQKRWQGLGPIGPA
jgi:hypothetical protein